MLATLQHALNVLCHNLSNPLNLPLRSLQRISLSSLCSALLNHQLLERRIEGRASIGRQIRKVGLARIEGFEEFLLEICQEAKGYALSEVALGDYEEG